MNSENKKIGQKIRKARAASGLTQNELGKKISKTGSAIGYLEGGLRKISPDTLKKIADALNKPFKYFYEIENNDYSIYEKMMAIEKQFKDLHETVKRSEKERFGFKEFYEDVVNQSPYPIIFINEDHKISHMNKAANGLLNTANKKNDFALKIKGAADIHQSEIKGAKKFTFKNIPQDSKKELLFEAKPVYEKNGKYLGIWVTGK